MLFIFIQCSDAMGLKKLFWNIDHLVMFLGDIERKINKEYILLCLVLRR
jgi:hypothetical protein